MRLGSILIFAGLFAANVAARYWLDNHLDPALLEQIPVWAWSLGFISLNIIVLQLVRRDAGPLGDMLASAAIAAALVACVFGPAYLMKGEALDMANSSSLWSASFSGRFSTPVGAGRHG